MSSFRRRISRSSINKPSISIAIAVCLGSLSWVPVTAKQDVRWINPLGGQYTQGSNWDVGTIPPPNSNIIFEDPGLDYVVGFSNGIYQTNEIQVSGTTDGTRVAFRPNGLFNSVLLRTNDVNISSDSFGNNSSTLTLGGIFGGSIRLEVANQITFDGGSSWVNVDRGATVVADSMRGRVLRVRNGGAIFANSIVASTEVSGVGSQVNVASNYQGTLRVLNGAALAAGTATVNLFFTVDNSSLNIANLTVLPGAAMQISDSQIQTGNVLINSSGTVADSVWSNTGSLTLTPSLSSIFSGLSFNITNSTWDNGGELILGEVRRSTSLSLNNSSMTFGSSGTVPSTLAVSADSTAVFDVNDSSAIFATDLVVGQDGNAAIDINNAGQIRNLNGLMALNNGSSAAVLVGANSSWTNVFDLSVGVRGAANLTIDGGTVSSENAMVAEALGSTATVNINGGGSWNVNQRLDIGGSSQGIGGTASIFLNNGTMNAGVTKIWNGSSLNLDGGALSVATLDAEGQFNFNSGSFSLTSANAGFIFDNGSHALGVNRQFSNAGQTLIKAGAMLDISSAASFGSASVVNHGRITLNSSGIVLGNAARHDGLTGDGELRVGGNSVTLRDAGLADLGRLTTLAGGDITAANGIALGTGDVLTGSGTVSGRVAGGVGSAIYVGGGELSVGDASSVIGFVTAGEIYTSTNTLRLKDANQVQLGSLTNLGDDGTAGRLEAISGAVIDFGENITGFGIIDSTDDLQSAFIINGAAIGDGIGQELTFEGYVKGVGTFDDVIFNGTFAPGLSPDEVVVGNLIFGDQSVLEMEIGGLVRGIDYDAIVSTGSLTFDGTLAVSMFNGFIFSSGEVFDILDWNTSSGVFDSIQLPTLSGGLTWDASQLYTTGQLRVSTVPEPSGGLIMFACIGWALQSRRRQS